MKSLALFFVSNGASLVIGVLAILLLFAACKPTEKNRVLRTSQLYLIVALTVVILTTILSGYLDMLAENQKTKAICEIVQYLFLYICYCIFTKYVGDELDITGKAYELLYYLFAAAIPLQAILIAEGKIVDFTASPCAIGSLYWVGFIYPAVVTVVVSILVILNKTKDTAQKLTLLLYLYPPALGIVMMTVYYGSFIFRLSSLTFVMLVYLVIYIDSAQKIIRREKELDESRIALMVSQIQPHFIYNTLNSIAGLCELDPAEAKELTLKFSDYLRNNLHALEAKAPIPFTKELEHIQSYLYIEQQRFRRLNVEYAIEAQDFSVPSLSIQPLVENAVKHGISMKRGGGTVTIKTRETENGYKIIISDDGVGFDTEKPLEKSHLGIANTRARLEDLGGRLKIHSKEGEGTKVTVFLPKKGAETL